MTAGFTDVGLPPVFEPMLPTSTTDPFDSPEFLYEVKWDGVRVLAFCDAEGTRLISRTGRDVTFQYPELSDLHTRLLAGPVVLDGEIVALDEAGRPSFGHLQKRINLARPGDIARAAQQPLDLVLFDLLFAGGRWLGGLPLEERIDRLGDAVEFGGRIMRSEAIPEHGLALFEAARSRGLEGIVAKRRSSHYVPGKRTRDWLKIKTVHDLDCVVGGFTPGNNSRAGSLGALLLGLYDHGALRYVGAVGTGFDEPTLAALRAGLGEITAERSPFGEEVPVRSAVWVEPVLVCKIEYRELTGAGKLRAASFKGLRNDKPPADCRFPAPDPAP